MTRKQLVLRMLSEGVKVIAIAEALRVSRVRVYEVIRGYTLRQKEYRRHLMGHNFKKDCTFCIREWQYV